MIDLIDQDRRRYFDELCVENWKLDNKSRLDHHILSQSSKRFRSSKSSRRTKYCEYDDEDRRSNARIERKEKRFSKNNNHFEQILHSRCCCIKTLSTISCLKLFCSFSTSSSINNLLALFLVIVTFCCQTFSIEYMTHQFLQTFSSTILSIEIFDLDLHISRTTFFSSTTSFIMTNFSSSTISQMMSFSTFDMMTHYFVSMFALESSNALFFTSRNVIEFLKRFEKQCDEHDVFETNKFKKLSRYCEKIIKDFVKFMSKWREQRWLSLCEAIQKEYVKDDVNQLINSRQFLKIFKSKTRVKIDDLRVYSRQFRSVAQNLKRIDKIDEYTMTTWYLQNLSKDVKIKVIKKHDINFFDATTLNFMKCYETIMFLTKTKLTLQQLNSSRNAWGNWSELIDRYKSTFVEIESIKQKTIFVSFVLFATSIINSSLNASSIDSLIKIFEDFRVNSARDMTSNEIKQLIRQKMSDRDHSRFAFAIVTSRIASREYIAITSRAIVSISLSN